MVHNVKYFGTLELVSLLCLKHIIWEVNHLYSLPKFASGNKNIQVGNGQYVSVLFIIAGILDIHDQRFATLSLDSQIHEIVDLILGTKNTFELEGTINSREISFSFLNRSLPFFSKGTGHMETKGTGVFFLKKHHS